MKVSIITATHNSANTIKDTIHSIINQSYDNIEIIIVDGVSIDNTIPIIEEIISNSKIGIKIICEPDNGIYDAMNKGIENATGDIIAILNSDDFYVNNFVIENIVNQFLEFKIDAIYCDILMVKYNNVKTIIRKWISKPYVNGSFSNGWHPPHPSLFVKKEVYKQFGKFDLDFKISADFEFMLRIFEKYKIKTRYYNSFVVNMRIGGASTNSFKNIIIGNINILKAFKKNEIYPSKFYTFKRFISKFLQYTI